MGKFLIIGFSYFFAGLSTMYSQVNNSHYRVYDTHRNKEISLEDIVNDERYFQVFVFGEEHNDSVSHYCESKLFELLTVRYGQQLALSMEMFDRDVQLIMDEYLDGHIREQNFKKDARAWSNYRDYRPMVEIAKTEQLDIICANAPRRYTNLAGRKGQESLMNLSPEAKSYMAPLPYPAASGGYYDKLIALTSHEPSNNDSAKVAVAPVANMGGFDLITAQSLWDATMAYSIYSYWKKNKKKKIFQVNGRFHSDEHFGLVTQLKTYNPKIKIGVISALSDDSFPNVDWDKFKHLGDFIILTDPNVPKTYE